MTIPSPYYFVPLSEHIFFPEWSARVSRDVPFKEGISGSIRILVTAETDIYIRSGTGEKGSSENNDFFRIHPGCSYAVNGTTMKGLLRSLVETASFGRFHQVEVKRYFAYRDLSSDYYIDLMVSTESGENGSVIADPRVNAGWLIHGQDGKWKIEKQKYARVEIELLEEYCSQDCSLGNRQKASQKYAQWNGTSLEVDFELSGQRLHDHSCTCLQCRENAKPPLWMKYQKVEKLGLGSRRGTIVFTGQPQAMRGRNNRRIRHRKHMEFIFYSDGEPEYMDVPAEVKKSFLDIHTDFNGAAAGAWEYWERQFNGPRKRKVPIFYLESVDNPGAISHLGLAQLFKFPYAHRIGDLLDRINPAHLDRASHNGSNGELPALDLAQTMFGTASDSSGLAGRIQIEPLLAEGNPRPLNVITTTLNSPKSSYFPNYLKQETNGHGRITGGYKTCNDADAWPSGRKHYPARKARLRDQEIPPAPNQDMRITFTPLPKGTRFTGAIHLHNILPRELGALLWALTWGGNRDLRHVIGMAKPFGFGTIKVEIIETDLYQGADETEVKETDGFIREFVAMMEEWAGEQGIGTGWHDSEQIRELLALADPANMTERVARLARYPRGPQKFAQFKRERKALLSYSRQIRAAQAGQ